MQITPFDYCGKTLSIIIDDKGDPWWIAKDVCCALGLTNVSKTLLMLELDEKADITGGKVGRNISKLRIINEPGLYRLLSRSNKKKSKKFQRIVFHDILPTIRKTGAYPPKDIDLPTTKLGWMKLAVEAEEKAVKLEKENIKLLPKADALDTISKTDGLYSFTKAAKTLEIKPKQFINLLLGFKVIYRKGGDLLPIQYFLNHGWFEVKMRGPEKKFIQTMVTSFGLTKLGTRFSKFFKKET